MCQNAVIPDMNPGSKPFDSSCNPYLNLDSRSPMRSARRPGMAKRSLTLFRFPGFISGASKTGFTLIELLVVVLIIGILSAAALPQYQKAVYKSRAMKVYSVFNKLEDAQKIFYLSNGRYATSAEELDFDFVTGTNFSFYFRSNFSSVWDDRLKGSFLEFNFNRSNGRYVKFCAVDTKSSNYEYGKQFCQEQGGVYSYTAGNGADYFILPNR